MVTDYSPCELHVPHKDWADDPREKRNYETLEQWSTRIPAYLGGTTGGQPYHFSSLSRVAFGGYASCFETGGGQYWPNGRPSPQSYYTYNWAVNHGGASSDDLGTGFTINNNNITLTTSGLFVFQGYLLFDFYNTTTPPPIGHYMLYSPNGWLMCEDFQRLFPLSVGRGNQGLRLQMGGGNYMYAGDQIVLRIEQTTPFAQQIWSEIGLTLMRL